MDSLATLHCRHQPLQLSLNSRPPPFPKSIVSLSFRTPLSSSSISSSPIKLSLRVSSSTTPSSSNPLYQTPKLPKPSILKTAGIAVAAAAALFFMRLQHKPAIAAPVATPTVSTQDNVPHEEQEQERALQEQLNRQPDDIEALRSLMEVKIKSRKLSEAIEVVDRLIELEPDDEEWPLLKTHILSYTGHHEEARKGFEEILAKDPFHVEAYHGLLIACSETDGSMDQVLKRIEGAMDRCKKENKDSELRDFKLLLAQSKVIEGNYFDAIKLYEQLAKDEPRDFRPYLCQGIIYTLLRKKDEAEKQFEKFRRLVPQNHPYKEYFFDNMFATKFFSEKVEREEAGLKS
ncbi:chloroplast lumen common family protein [Tripterygium wilfordii]|uniref:Chloroplast lumen common family protein n=1 Tax=Tripterygium wilfordii TaxID=458696 RepID=A0A7J7DME6_TRIWF|nr:protein SLOW GREEN 1, chloroplastic-like [Tripterygium wilfordii]XP_038701245.1 protein SLOW GREEN 1, chloroplastic-like [Tripterygium wilfordii]XP_038701246.1 protein SLOW GREEN 1, chloroplastic-like [Tripterygium wilfordii]XP_038701247.1 protein SLOW GREEN 1, chloroplastic-like [Tripterygium wilfordii]KAF5747540.1 chloroplast lumen common family protein [Tripterygium wilfordii]